MRCIAFVALVLAAALVAAQDPSWDKQTKTYTAVHTPVTVDGNLNITAYFSPDHSADTHVEAINNAQTSIDIGEPGFDSWIGCTDGTTCIGCNITGSRNLETFPLWGALLNAAHRGVTIRLLTNDYGTPDCQGMISPLPFFQLNNINVRYYATTTYIHAKYMMIDGKIISVSSVNWSHASYMGNREAGALLRGAAAKPLIDFANGVFNYDWSVALPLVVAQTYSAADMAIITDPSPIPVTIPPIPTIHDGRYVTPTPVSVEGDTNVMLYTSPDDADATLLADINSATSNLTIHMYQVTSPDLCNAIQTINAAGNVQINLMVAARIYDAGDCAAAKLCYAQLYNAGMSFVKTPWYYTYSHQKYWIVDGARVGWSTGNWSPTDYPAGASNVYPPYGTNGWRNSNRDFTVTSDSQALIQQFQAVYNGDYADSDQYSPQYDIKCGY